MQHVQGKETINCKFHNPPPKGRGCDFWLKNVKFMYFFKIFFSFSKHISDKLSMQYNQGRVYQNCKGVPVVGCGHIGQITGACSHQKKQLILVHITTQGRTQWRTPPRFDPRFLLYCHKIVRHTAIGLSSRSLYLSIPFVFPKKPLSF